MNTQYNGQFNSQNSKRDWDESLLFQQNGFQDNLNYQQQHDQRNFQKNHYHKKQDDYRENQQNERFNYYQNNPYQRLQQNRNHQQNERLNLQDNQQYKIQNNQGDLYQNKRINNQQENPYYVKKQSTYNEYQYHNQYINQFQQERQYSGHKNQQQRDQFYSGTNNYREKYDQQRNNYEGNYNSYSQNNYKMQNYDQSYDYNPQQLQPLQQEKYQFSTDFPRLPIYNDLQEIRNKFKPLGNVNKSNVELNSNDFVKLIRPINIDNIHKAIKYGIWTSMARKNIDIIQCWKLATEKQGRVFFVFVPFYPKAKNMPITNIVGIAKMEEDFQPHKHFKYWDYENKFFGLFNLSWVYVKNVPVSEIPIQHNESILTLNNLRDGAILAHHDAVNIFKTFNDKPEFYDTLFEQFPQLDQVEDQIRYERQNNKLFQDQFKQMAEEFETNFKQFIQRNFQNCQ